ncbi:RNA polymerase sigma factor [Lignipirellula cremea]|uniref:RNA polymerase sigma factor n=1 Tax=Lignipirellula cremea TaxID=2528010 RepID=A0A518DVR7_9BACT|nr:sigma-70 family RNA polymerase sigma factor [Lignipirellula cremea]QDU95928.1 RNA polymerase sigma factor [Lignipirellula cremea]
MRRFHETFSFFDALSGKPRPILDSLAACMGVASRIGASTISELQQSFQRLVDQHYESLWAYVSCLMGSAPEGEDILHRAFLAAFDRLDDPTQPIRDPELWLRGVVRRLVAVWRREQQRLPQDLSDQLSQIADAADDAATDVLRAERNAALQRCLGRLTPNALRMVTARYEQGLRITQIAQQEKINEATARVALFRIRKSLKSCLELALGGARS